MVAPGAALPRQNERDTERLLREYFDRVKSESEGQETQDQVPALVEQDAHDTLDAQEPDATAEPTPKRGRGRPIKHWDAKGTTIREQARANAARSPEDRNPVGRKRKEDERVYARRLELKIEKEIVEETASRRMDEREGQKAFIAALGLKRGKEKLKGPMTSMMKTPEEISEIAQLHKNTRMASLQKSLSRNQRNEIKDTLTTGLAARTAASVLGLTEQSIRRRLVTQTNRVQWKAMVEMETITEDDEFDVHTVQELETRLYTNFFKDHAGVVSGSHRLLRVLTIPKFKLFSRLFGAYPSLLRQLNRDHPDLMGTLTVGSRLRTAMEAALANAKREGFNEDEECQTRTVMAEQKYKAKLAAKRLRTNRSIAPARVNKKAVSKEREFTPEEVTREKLVKPVGDKKFMCVIKEAGIRFTKKTKPYNCKIHDQGPTWQPKLAKCVSERVIVDERLDELTKRKNTNLSGVEKQQLADLTTQHKELLRKQRKYTEKIQEFAIHLEQFAKCRVGLQNLEKALKPGECLIYRDFVNQYNTDGDKIANLQLVILYRLEPGVALTQLKVYNFSGGAQAVRCDPFFVADVMDFHMKTKDEGGSGVFDRFDKIYVSGDHGSHFSATKTVFNETRMFRKYGKKVHVLSLCSYHCYNRCDAAGVLSKRISEQKGREGVELVTSADFAQAINDDAATDTVGFDFKEINRGVGVFGDDVIVSKKSDIGADLRKMCEIDYEVNGSAGDGEYLDGVAKCRLVPFEGEFIVFELRERLIKTFCQRCSAVQTGGPGPVYHEGKAQCPAAANDEDSVTRGINVSATPADDPRRRQMLEGPQETKNTKAVKRFPCRFCTSRYAHGYTANNHMEKKHQELCSPADLYKDDHKSTKEAKKKAKKTKKKAGKKASESSDCEEVSQQEDDRKSAKKAKKKAKKKKKKLGKRASEASDSEEGSEEEEGGESDREGRQSRKKSKKPKTTEKKAREQEVVEEGKKGSDSEGDQSKRIGPEASSADDEQPSAVEEPEPEERQPSSVEEVELRSSEEDVGEAQDQSKRIGAETSSADDEQPSAMEEPEPEEKQPSPVEDAGEAQDTTQDECKRVEWMCPCGKVVCQPTASSTKLQQRKHRNKSMWLCEAAQSECLAGEVTDVQVHPVHLVRVEVKKGAKGAWVTFDATDSAGKKDEGNYWYHEEFLFLSSVAAGEALVELAALVKRSSHSQHIRVAVPAPAAVGLVPEVTAFETQRLERIAENQRQMASLGIPLLRLPTQNKGKRKRPEEEIENVPAVTRENVTEASS